MDSTPYAGQGYERCVIKSFKNNGALHRVWLENWQVPREAMRSSHLDESMWVFVNEHTGIREADGKEWVSRVPAVSFFIPGEWFNVVALLEEKGIRYYCNVASPPCRYADVLTYIDYDLDMILLPDGSYYELDRDEYDRHKEEYRYHPAVRQRAEEGLVRLRSRIADRASPFGDAEARRYYDEWKAASARKAEEDRT
jgi:protein associated with RNAse G/E